MSNIQAINLCKSYLRGGACALRATKPEVVVRVERDIGWVLPIITVGAAQSAEIMIRAKFEGDIEKQNEAVLVLDNIVNMHGLMYEKSLAGAPQALNGFKQLAEYLDTDLKREIYGHFTMSFMLGCHALLIVPPLNRLGLTPDLARVMLEPLTAVPILSMLTADTRAKVLNELRGVGACANMPNVQRLKLEAEDYMALIEAERKADMAKKEVAQ